MAQLSLGMFELGNEIEVDFGEFFSLVKGMSIKSAADWGDGRFEIGLSGGLMLRIFQSDSSLRLNVISTINKDELSPLILTLPSETDRPSAGDLENRLHGLRQLYAIVYLLASDDPRLAQLEKLVKENIGFDIESNLLEPSERLYIESFAPGSWITTIWAKTKEAKAALTLLSGLVYQEGRDNMLRRIKAETRIKEVEAESKEFDLFARRLEYVQKIAKKKPGLHAIIDKRIEDALIKLLDGSNSNVKITEIKSELTGQQPNVQQDHGYSIDDPSM
jgi:chorismate mutase